jgi:flavorubredoxin
MRSPAAGVRLTQDTMLARSGSQDMTIGEPVRVCRDTWLLTQLAPAPPFGRLFVNSAVITAAEPIVIDTGAAANRDVWLGQLETVLDPTDIRWIFISHDDADHIGNLAALWQRCPRATVVGSWLALARLALEHDLRFPADRIRVVEDGDTLEIGGRALRVTMPPVFDNPTTRGLLDPSTGFFWAADCFAAPVQKFLTDADDTPDHHWRQGFLALHQLLWPWHTLIDPRRYGARIDQLQHLPITTAAGAHGPLVRGDRLVVAWRLLRELPHLRAQHPLAQTDLEHWMTTTATTIAHGPVPTT